MLLDYKNNQISIQKQYLKSFYSILIKIQSNTTHKNHKTLTNRLNQQELKDKKNPASISQPDILYI